MVPRGGTAHGVHPALSRAIPGRLVPLCRGGAARAPGTGPACRVMRFCRARRVKEKILSQAIDAAPASDRPARHLLSGRNLYVGAIGNILEWYDFGLYGFFAPVIAGLFFPGHNALVSLIGAYGGFAVGFVMRPIGGVVLGHLGDRYGRKRVLVVSVVLMGAATTVIGFLPTYGRIGLLAPVLLVLARIFQGFSVGGEFTGSVTYLVETAPRRHRGFAGSFANIGSTGGALLAAGVAAFVTLTFSHDQLWGWAWRLPFLFGGVLALAAYLVRSRLTESGFVPEPAAEGVRELPIRQAFRRSPRAMFLAMVFTSGYGIAFYLTMIFLPVYAAQFGHVGQGRALQINTVGQALALVVVPLAGWLTDRVIRRRTMLILAFGLTAASAPVLFGIAHGGGIGGLWAAQLLFGVIAAMVMGTAPAMLAELFHGAYRLSGYSLSFNLGLGLAGGTAPMIATGLIALTGNPLAPAWYLVAGAVVAMIGVYFMRDGSREPLL